MKFDTFRAYGVKTATRKGVEVNEDTLKAHRVKIEYPVEEVIFEGKADKGGETATFSTDETVTRVVFFATAKDEEGEVVEICLGVADVGASGDISVPCPEPEKAPDPTEIV